MRPRAADAGGSQEAKYHVEAGGGRAGHAPPGCCNVRSSRVVPEDDEKRDDEKHSLRFIWSEKRWWRILPISIISAAFIAPIAWSSTASFLFGGRYKISLAGLNVSHLIMDVQGCSITWSQEHVQSCENPDEWEAGWDPEAPYNPAACGATILSYNLMADHTYGHFYAPADDDDECSEGCIGVNYIAKDMFGRSNPSFGPWQGEQGKYASPTLFRWLYTEAELANPAGIDPAFDPVKVDAAGRPIISIKPQAPIVGVSHDNGATTEDTFTSPGYCFVTLPKGKRRDGRNKMPRKLELRVGGAFAMKTKLLAEGHPADLNPRQVVVTADGAGAGDVLVDMHDVHLDTFSLDAADARLQMTNVSVASLEVTIRTGYADISTVHSTTLAAATANEQRCATGATVTAIDELSELIISNGVDAPSQNFEIHVVNGDLAVNVWGKQAMASTPTVPQSDIDSALGRYLYQKFDSEFNRTARKRNLRFSRGEMEGINQATLDLATEIVDVRVGGTGYLPMMTFGQLALGVQGYAANNVFGFQLPMRTGPFGFSRRAPFHYHTEPASISALSLGQLQPRRRHYDLTMRTGFCPTFHKLDNTCPSSLDSNLENGATISTCSSEFRDQLLDRKYRFECAPNTHTGAMVISTLLNPDAYCDINDPLSPKSSISLHTAFSIEKLVFTAARLSGLEEAVAEENGIEMNWGLEFQELLWGTFSFDKTEEVTQLVGTSKQKALTQALMGVTFIGAICLVVIVTYMSYRAFRSHLIEFKLDLLFAD